MIYRIYISLLYYTNFSGSFHCIPVFPVRMESDPAMLFSLRILIGKPRFSSVSNGFF